MIVVHMYIQPTDFMGIKGRGVKGDGYNHTTSTNIFTNV